LQIKLFFNSNTCSYSTNYLNHKQLVHYILALQWCSTRALHNRTLSKQCRILAEGGKRSDSQTAKVGQKHPNSIHYRSSWPLWASVRSL